MNDYEDLERRIRALEEKTQNIDPMKTTTFKTVFRGDIILPDIPGKGNQ